MAAPTPTARAAPVGLRLRDGFRTLITFGRAPNLSVWETAVTPPGADCGDPVNTTTMHNLRYRTKSPRKLIDTTPASMTVAYDPIALDTILDDLINVLDEITITFSDGSTWAFWGWLRSFTPQESTEGSMPLANIVIEVSNEDPTHVERDAVIASVSGT